MAAEIVPISLGLTEGNGLTLWAPRWIEDGEEWEAFLGHEDDLYVFPTAAHVAAFIRGTDEHDLSDHPEWSTVRKALADELVPDEDHRFDIVGVPDLVAEPADVWTIAELADTIAILRSIAEVCGLDAIEEVLNTSDGFTLLGHGSAAFTGRQGEKLWDEIGAVVAEQWDKIVDAIDGIVNTPRVDADELATAEAELAAVSAATLAADSDEGDDGDDRDPDLEFWDNAGIDPVEITVGGRTGWTLRWYLEDRAVFLAAAGRVLIFSTPDGLETYLADASVSNTLTKLGTSADIRTAVAHGEAAVLAGPENVYRMDGVGEGLVAGPGSVDARQLELAVELLRDAAQARGDEDTIDALGSSSPLGYLVSAIVRPSPDRMPPSPPFADEAAAFAVLTEQFSGTLDWDAHDKDDAFTGNTEEIDTGTGEIDTDTDDRHNTDNTDDRDPDGKD
ncbi:MAG: primosomal protein [Actinomycetota bacterium]|nr:primosomal protein [Actinomycetota bacterium]